MLKRVSVLTLAALIGASASAIGAVAVAPAPVSQVRPDDGSEYKKILDSASPALVTVKFVLKSEGEGGFGDAEEEITGVMIDPKGIVLCSYFSMGGAAGMLGRGAAPTPQDVKVLIGDDTEGKKAKVLSHDSELDLAWVQLDEAPATPLKAVDLDKAAAASVGQHIYLLSRMDKYFDRANVINEGRVRGVVQKPRHLLAPGGNLITERNDLGMPVFNADAAIVGFIVIQIPDKESMEGGPGMGGGPMILPAEAVAKATKRALESHEKEGATKEPAKEPAKGDAPKPEGDKK